MAAGIGEAAAIIAVVQLAGSVISYVKKVSEAPAAKTKLLHALVQARGLLTTLHDLTEEVEDEQWARTIQSLEGPGGPLVTFQTLLEQVAKDLGLTPTEPEAPPANKRFKFSIKLPRSITQPLAPLRWPWDETRLNDMMGMLERLKTQFNLALSNDHIQLSLSIRNEVQEARSAIKAVHQDVRRSNLKGLTVEQELIVQSLAIMNFTDQKTGAQIMARRVAAEWLLRHPDFEAWHNPSNQPGSLLLTGQPGSGRTTMSHVVGFFLKAWHGASPDTCTVTVMCEPAQHRHGYKNKILSKIVQELLRQAPYLWSHCAELRITGWGLTDVDCLTFISSARQDLGRLYLILDGIDDYFQLWDVVGPLLAINPPISLFVTSQPLPTTIDIFRDHSHIDIAQSITTEDTAAHVRQLVLKDERVQAMLRLNNVELDDAVNSIVHRSNGLYVLCMLLTI